jgi:hypothetical protein
MTQNKKRLNTFHSNRAKKSIKIRFSIYFKVYFLAIFAYTGLDTNFFSRWYAGPLDPKFRWSFLNTGGPFFFLICFYGNFRFRRTTHKIGDRDIFIIRFITTEENMYFFYFNLRSDSKSL